MDFEIAKGALKVIANNPEIIANYPELIKDLDMPNIATKTMGGKVWWRDLVSLNGWRIQQNLVTKHCRILDPDDVRRAWGGEDAMMNLFKKILK